MIKAPRESDAPDMDTKSHRIGLTQKRNAETGQLQFYPVQWDGNKPDPRFVLID